MRSPRFDRPQQLTGADDIGASRNARLTADSSTSARAAVKRVSFETLHRQHVASHWRASHVTAEPGSFALHPHYESILTCIHGPVCINASFELTTLIYLPRFAMTMFRKEAAIATVSIGVN
ncbi:MAG TPA: hypothetical protein VFV97_11170 [Rhodanobacteraceae bacterium]|nr:hypothetical protein [Rhodanobacteraceae bacterium]